MRRHIAAFACIAALPALSAAAEWKVAPTFSLSADTDSNRRLLLEPRSSESAILASTLAIARLTEISSFTLAPRISIARYRGEDALNSNDWGVGAQWHRNGERTVIDLQGGISDNSTLTTELGETGFVEGNTRRRSTELSASLLQYVSTRHLFQYGVSASDIDYQQTQGTGLVGYRYPSASLTWIFNATQRLDTTVTYTAARLTASSIDVQSDTRGAQFGLRYQLSPRFDVEARVGRSSTRAHGSSDSQESYHGALSWHDERSRLEFSVSRDVEPSGRGLLVNADDVRLEYSRDLTEHLTLDASVRASRREDFSFDLRHNDYRYDAAALALSWRLDEHWALALAGAYARQDYQLATDGASGRRVGLNLSWRPLQ